MTYLTRAASSILLQYPTVTADRDPHPQLSTAGTACAAPTRHKATKQLERQGCQETTPVPAGPTPRGTQSLKAERTLRTRGRNGSAGAASIGPESAPGLSLSPPLKAPAELSRAQGMLLGLETTSSREGR